MNYPREINQFYDWLETNDLSKSAVALWNALMHINNKANWIETFTVAISTLEFKTKFKRSELFKGRNELTQKGRIKWKQRGGSLSAEYQIIPFCVHNTDAIGNANGDTNGNTTGNTNGTINKLNNTKLNETNITPLPPKGESEIKPQKDIPTWKKDFDVYMKDLREAYARITNDLSWMAKQQGYYPNVDILKSIEKACVNYWATEAGWKKKRGAKIQNIDWKSTFGNSINLNKVYYERNSNTKSGAGGNSARTDAEERRRSVGDLADLATQILQQS